MPSCVLSGCGENFTALSGTIISPGYPVAYSNNLDCNYDISVASNQFITLAFEEPFFIEGQGRKPIDADVEVQANKSRGAVVAMTSPVVVTPPGGNS